MYADYDFYLNRYFGDVVSEEDFPRLSERASDYIRAATQGISDKVDGWQLEAVKKASCAIADVLLDESVMTAGVFAGSGSAVSSEAVGSWSRSYKSPSISAAEVEYLDKKKVDLLRMYLGNLPAFATIFKVRSFKCLHRTECTSRRG